MGEKFGDCGIYESMTIQIISKELGNEDVLWTEFVLHEK